MLRDSILLEVLYELSKLVFPTLFGAQDQVCLVHVSTHGMHNPFQVFRVWLILACFQTAQLSRGNIRSVCRFVLIEACLLAPPPNQLAEKNLRSFCRRGS